MNTEGISVHRRSLVIGHWSLVIALLLLFWGRVLVNVRDQSPTMDEPFHLVRGVAYWRTGDLRLQYEHPPLSHALSGLFLALEPDLPSPADLKGWNRASCIDVTRHLLLEPGWPIERVLFLARWPMLALGLVLSALVCRWAGELFGRWAGLAALFLCTFDPNILAHSSLITTDMAVTCLACAACYTFSRWLAQPTSGRLLLAGLTLGLAWGAKLSALILLPVLGLVLLWHAWRRKASLWNLLIGFVAILSVSLLVLWALYRFESGVWSPAGTWMPMPTHWDNLQRLWQHQASGQRAFFIGQLSDEGWWYYFPVLFVIKTPLPLLILLVVAVVMAWPKKPFFLTDKMLPRTPGGTKSNDLLAQIGNFRFLIIIFPAFYFAVSIASRINIGYRHILPVVPFVAMGAATAFHYLLVAPVLGGGMRRSWWHTPIGHWSLVIGHCLLVLWMTLSSLWIHPYYLAYFNELVGGPDQGYRYAVDSNLDWGQDLKRLRAYLDERGIDRIKLSYFGTARPERYGIEYDPLPMPPPSSPSDFSPLNPEPGVYAISASNLQLLEDPDVFDWFRRRQPTAKVGYSIFIYDVVDQLEGQWAAVCYAPVPALEADQIRDALGNPDLRLVYFDCRSSWVYPAGTAPGWYVIPDVIDGPTVVSVYRSDAEIVFHGRRTNKRLGLTIYWGEGAGSQPVHLTTLEGSDDQPQFADVARFLGYEVDSSGPAPGGTLTSRTYWEVLNRPDFPLSVMAHLVDAQGTLIAVADGLSFPMENWQKGDVFAQTHVFTLPSSHTPTLPYSLNVGLYRLDTMERIPPAGSETDHLILGPIKEQGDGR